MTIPEHLSAKSRSAGEVPDATRLEVREIKTITDEGFNPSAIVDARGELLVNVRQQSPDWSSRNFLYFKGADHAAHLPELDGLEDVRLFYQRGQLCGIGAVCDNPADPHSMSRAVVVNIETRKREELPTFGKPERNWVPILGDKGFVYAPTSPPMVWPRDAERIRQHGPPGYNTLRGGSQLIAYDGGYLAVVHETICPPRVYVHRFARFDHELVMTRVGPRFFFEHVGIEFCAGLCFHDGEFVLSYGYQHRVAKLARVSPEVVKRMSVVP